MFRAACIESVFNQIVRTRQKPKPAGRNNDVDIPAHRADRAIAILNLEGFGKIGFELDCAAMTAALVGLEYRHASDLQSTGVLGQAGGS